MTLTRARAIATGVVVAIFAALITITFSNRLVEPQVGPKAQLIAGTDFTISSSISSSSSSAISALLYPGTQRYLVFTVKNNLTVPIKVTSLGISSVTSPATCPASVNLDTSQTSFASPPAPALNVAPSPATNFVIVPIALKNVSSQSPGCENKTFNFTYTGTAVPVYATATTLAAAPNPSTSPQSVTFTASVSPTPTPPSAPTGTVNFYSCPTSACASQTLLGSGAVSANGTSGKATFTTSTLPAGNNFIQAVYQGDQNFTTSTSSVVTQLVYSSCVTANQNGNLTVGSGQFICVTASGKVNGTATINSGGALYVTGGTVNNNVTVNAGGGLFVSAGSSINGSITATSPTVINICGAKKINGSISVSGAASQVLIGDGSSCGGNDINNTVTLANNTAGYKLIGNSINGNVSVTSNTGAGVIGNNNKINGNLGCTGNSPAPTNGGQPNSVKGTRTGQCAAL